MRKSAAPSLRMGSNVLNDPATVSWPAKTTVKPSFTRPTIPSSSVSKGNVTHSGSSSKAEASTDAPPGAARSTASILRLLAGNQEKENEPTIDENVKSSSFIQKSISTSISEEKHQFESVRNISQKPDNEKSSAQIEQTGIRIFTVVWGKPTTKKHKTWEGDGTLEIQDTNAILKDENGKVLGRASKIKPAEMEEGKRLKVGSKEVELIDLLTTTPESAKRPIEDDTPEEKSWKRPKKGGFFQSKGAKVNPGNNPLMMSAPSNNHQWEYNAARMPIVPVYVDGFLSNVLRPHQRVGVSFLYDCITGLRNLKQRGAILADEMGLGKTLQCITLIWTILRQGPYGGRPLAKRVLVVSPSSLVQNWQNEFKRWLGTHRLSTFAIDQKNRPSDFLKYSHIPVLLVSYEMLTRHIEEIKKIKFDLLICDEGHRLKNSNIRTSMLLSQLPIKARIILTGTPIQNNLQELYALVDFVNPDILGSPAEFRKRFEEPIVALQQPDTSEDILSLGKERAEELSVKTNGFILRRTQDLLDKYLPKKTEVVVFVKPTSLQLSLYHTALQWWADQKLLPSFENNSVHFAVMMTLKKLCNHPSMALTQSKCKEDNEDDLVEQAGLLSTLTKKYCGSDEMMRNVASSNQSGKLLVLRGLLLSLAASKEKIVLVSYFTQTLNLLALLCDELNLKHCRLDGSTPSAQRMSLVDQFNAQHNKCDVFLLSARAGGVGLNLIGASRLLLFDSDWNPANDLQAMSRVWRDGQRRDVYIYRLLTCGTIEEKIFQRQLSKTGLSGSIVDPRALGAVRMSKAELKDLFTPHEGESSLTHVSLECPCSGLGEVPDVLLREDLSDEEDARDCQLKLGQSISAPRSNKLSMNQLMLWQHHGPPYQSGFLKEIALSSVADHLVFMFCNPSTQMDVKMTTPSHERHF